MLQALLLLSLTIDPFEGLPNVELEVPVAGQLESMGTKVDARAYRVKLKPADAWAWVFASFVKHDLFIPDAKRRGEIIGAPQLTGYDHPTRTSYTAIFKDNGDGTTTVIAGRADLAGGWVKAVASVPTVPGATQIAQASSEDGVTVTYLVKASAEEVDGFYAEVLKKSGFQRDEERKGWVKAGQLLELRHGARASGQRSVAVSVRPVRAP